MNHRENLNRLPGPLCQLVGLYSEETDVFRKVIRLRDCFEWIIKWHTVTTLSYILEHDSIGSDRLAGLQTLLDEKLRSPSLGVWMDFFRVGKKLLHPNLPPWLEGETLLNLESKKELVNFRNKLAHGPFVEDAECRDLLNKYEPVLEPLLNSTCLDLLLVVEAGEGRGGQVLRGETPKPHDLAGPRPPYVFMEDEADRTASGFSLWPLAEYCPAIRQHEPGLFYFNALKGEKIEQLSYELPAMQRNPDLWDDFMDKFRYREWRRATVDPFQNKIDELTEDFVGRSKERTELREFCIEDKGSSRNMMLVKASPGSGKSALAAILYRELTDNKTLEGDPVGINNTKVISYFISGNMEKTPIYFLKTIISNLEEKMDMKKEGLRETEWELATDFHNRLQQADKILRSNGDRLVIIIDGIDESDSIRQCIPCDIPRNIRMVCLGRSGNPVVDELWDNLEREKRKHLTINPLGVCDINEMLEKVVHPLATGFTKDWIQTIERKSEGNPFYLKMLCEELLSREEEAVDASQLPAEIESLWDKCFDRLSGKGEDAMALKTLRLLAVCKAPVTDLFVATILGKDSVICRNKLSDVGELLQEHQGDGIRPAKSFYHSSLHEWIRKENPLACNVMADRIVEMNHAQPRSPEISSYLLNHLVSHLVEMED